MTDTRRQSVADRFFLCLYTEHFCSNLFKERERAQVQDLVSKNNVDQIPKPHCIHNLISSFTILLVLAQEVRVRDRYSKTKRGRQLFLVSLH